MAYPQHLDLELTGVSVHSTTSDGHLLETRHLALAVLPAISPRLSVFAYSVIQLLLKPERRIREESVSPINEVI